MKKLVFDYTNYKNIRSVRNIIPEYIYHGKNEF